MILVTGATGNVGGQVLAQLLERGIPARAMTRDPESAHLPGGAEVVRGDLADPEGLEMCLDGVDAVFLMWPFHDARPVTTILEVIKRHAQRVVLLSSGAVQDGFAPDQHTDPVGRSHAEVEHRVQQSGLAWTVLRPSTFAANALWWADQIRDGDTVAGPFGAVRMAMLHEADIAAVAVAALTGDGHDQACYQLTGPELLTQSEQVHIIGQALGRRLRWQELSREQARQRLLDDESFPDSFVDVLLDGYAKMLDAPAPPVTRTIETVTGAPARTFHQWAADHAEQFSRQ
ncbi:NAD(P)H-binding protein [Actinomadura harenae]|uniref:NAD-dependent epimerase/dehydratase family protein n=1 Tax=Actinomadura harenae TaxID=2483351 RepID=A0A3M2M799_9ACTN|nr:NAD(P)H-binding protein [Actinomadura harenae]RMI45466.1 NAD-dependent epimerase/dehydratase family protein [Actinomadura harenae]